MKKKINLKKLDSRSTKAKFIGFDDKSMAYIRQEFCSMKIIKARNVIFEENYILAFSTKETINPKESILVSPNMDLEDDRTRNTETTENPVQDKGEENNVPTPVVQNQQEDVKDQEEDNETSLPRESRNRRLPKRYGLPYTFSATKNENVQEPKSYNQAMKSLQAENWQKAMTAEYDSLINNKTWTLVNEPENKQVLPGKWVHRVKYADLHNHNP